MNDIEHRNHTIFLVLFSASFYIWGKENSLSFLEMLGPISAMFGYFAIGTKNPYLVFSFFFIICILFCFGFVSFFSGILWELIILTRMFHIKQKERMKLQEDRIFPIRKFTETIEICQAIEESESDEVEDSILRKETTKIALVLSELWDPESKEGAEVAMTRLTVLAEKQTNRKFIRIAGGIPVILHILEFSDPSIGLFPLQSLSLRTLALLARNVKNREEIMHNNGITIVVRLTKVKDEADFLETLKIIKELGKNGKIANKMREANLLDFLLAKINHNFQQEDQLEMILEILALIPPVPEKIKRFQGLSNFVPFLYHSSPNVKTKAFLCITEIAKSGKSTRADLKKNSLIIPRIVEMLSSPNGEVKRAAIRCISALADSDRDTQNKMRNAGVVPLLIDILTNENGPIIEYTCEAIHSLVKQNPRIQRDFRGTTAIPIITELIKESNVGTKIQAISTVIELTRKNQKMAELFCRMGAIKSLVRSLQYEIPTLQYVSLGAIWSLVHYGKTRNPFGEIDIIPILNTLLLSDHTQVKKGARWTLEVCRP